MRAAGPARRNRCRAPWRGPTSGARTPRSVIPRPAPGFANSSSSDIRPSPLWARAPAAVGPSIRDNPNYRRERTAARRNAALLQRPLRSPCPRGHGRVDQRSSTSPTGRPMPNTTEPRRARVFRPARAERPPRTCARTEPLDAEPNPSTRARARGRRADRACARAMHATGHEGGGDGTRANTRQSRRDKRR